MIASVAFRNFKALRDAQLALGPFNLVVGPNGSGKTSLIQALLHLRALSPLRPGPARRRKPGEMEIVFHLAPPYTRIEARLGCTSDYVCDRLQLNVPASDAAWKKAKGQLARIRSFLFDHYAMAAPARRADGAELSTNAANLAAVLAGWQKKSPGAFAALQAEFLRIEPDFSALELRPAGRGEVGLAAVLDDGGEIVTAENLSQGALYLLALLTLAFDPQPPSVVCLEELDRGLHPRLLREARDALYRLSHPEAFGLSRPPVQVIATTHSPYLLDLFKDHPEEVVIAQKRGRAAYFERLADRADLSDLLAEGPLGDLWFSGVLGGVPEEK
ncbi:MAG TPA: AAA family ATPase [Opitutaceae bacterium]|nr:AAA family ATPase [Opitutaceae bacterium]